MGVLRSLRSPNLGKQTAVCHHLTRIANESGQEAVFDRRQVHFAAAHKNEVCGQIDFQIAIFKQGRFAAWNAIIESDYFLIFLVARVSAEKLLELLARWRERPRPRAAEYPPAE